MLFGCLLLVLLPAVFAVDGHGHDDDKFHACTLCNECFVDYVDYDIWIPKRPYMMANMTNGIVSLQECLAACMHDDMCAAAVYGLIGGRMIYTCELYDKINPTTAPRYTPYINTYVKRRAMPCMVDYSMVKVIELIPATDEPEKRKHRYSKLYSRRNPFYWGRK